MTMKKFDDNIMYCGIVGSEENFISWDVYYLGENGFEELTAKEKMKKTCLGHVRLFASGHLTFEVEVSISPLPTDVMFSIVELMRELEG